MRGWFKRRIIKSYPLERDFAFQIANLYYALLNTRIMRFKRYNETESGKDKIIL